MSTMTNVTTQAVPDEQSHTNSLRRHLRSASQRKLIVPRYHIDWTAMVVGVLLLRTRRPGIRCQTVFVTQL